MQKSLVQGPRTFKRCLECYVEEMGLGTGKWILGKLREMKLEGY